ncbi:MAG: hypothetical protein HFH31_01320 [Bacilli bacterium]|nr:hypothetical protein [Bacilli bacterium]
MIQNLKSYIKRVKELLQDPRTRAATILVLWFFFFLFVFSTLNTNRKSSSPTYSTIDKWKSSNNYEAKINITRNDEIYHIDSVRNGNQEVFSLDDRTYILDYNKLYVFENDLKLLKESTILLDFDFLKLRPNFLGQLVSNGNLEYTTNYESGIIKKGYSIETAKFVELYDGMIITDDTRVIVELTEQDNVITEVNLDLKNYQKYNQDLIKEYKIQIIYSSIGMISNINLE